MPDFAERTVRDNLAQAWPRNQRVAFNGSGASGEPTGVLNTAGIGTFPGTTITHANILESQTDVLTANALGEESKSGYTCRPAVASVLAARQGFSTLMPLWVGPLNAGTIVGAPAFTSMTVPTATLVCGDFRKLLLAEWRAGVLADQSKSVREFSSGDHWIPGCARDDVGVAWQTAFTVATSVS